MLVTHEEAERAEIADYGLFGVPAVRLQPGEAAAKAAALRALLGPPPSWWGAWGVVTLCVVGGALFGATGALVGRMVWDAVGFS